MSFARTAHRPLRTIGGASLAVGLAGCSSALLDPRGPIGRQEKLIPHRFDRDHARDRHPGDDRHAGVCLVVPRRQHPAKRHLDWAYSGRIEFVVWAFPALVILFLGGIAWLSSHDLDPPKAIESSVAPLDVEVVSLDWKWLFIYPDAGVASLNRLVVPIGTPVRFRMTSASVMNSFFIPQLGSQIYTMAGMATRLNLLVDDPASITACPRNSAARDSPT
ncbi:MAG: hypothetical protein WDM77_12890 [Steroidobacteraceae bacterium]